MASSRYEKFFDDVFNESENHDQKGFLKNNVKQRLSFNDDLIFEIPLIYQYRPDKIASRFYGNPKLYWVLVYVNDIHNSPEGFYLGRRIRIPRVERVTEVV
jgi:hypothetical protein